MLYTLRTSPCFLSPELELFDQLQRKLLGSVANIDLFVNDRAWAKASLRVWSDGLGELLPSWHLLPFWPLLLGLPTSPANFSLLS